MTAILLLRIHCSTNNRRVLRFLRHPSIALFTLMNCEKQFFPELADVYQLMLFLPHKKHLQNARPEPCSDLGAWGIPQQAKMRLGSTQTLLATFVTPYFEYEKTACFQERITCASSGFLSRAPHTAQLSRAYYLDFSCERTF